MIHHGDCLEIMPTLPAESVDAIVTDPPYGLSFMGKNWDHGIPGESFWREALRIAKPGTHLLAFGGTRTFHRLTCGIEDAGWEIRDCIMWVYGSGFPKSHNLSGDWQGWGTALKPAWEPIIVARKPLAGTVAQNVQEYGTGAMNVDGCRVETDELSGKIYRNSGANLTWGGTYGNGVALGNSIGRWPANLIHDGSDEVTGLFPETTSGGGNKSGQKNSANCYGKYGPPAKDVRGIDFGSAARFFYCPKASKADRDEGCDGFVRKGNAVESAHSVVCAICNRQKVNVSGECKCESPSWVRIQQTARANHHPTVKPTPLMRYLCRLVTPPGGIVFDPFCGSGSTGKAATLEGFQFIGIEREAEYAEIAKARIANARGEQAMPLLAGIS